MSRVSSGNRGNSSLSPFQANQNLKKDLLNQSLPNSSNRRIKVIMPVRPAAPISNTNNKDTAVNNGNKVNKTAGSGPVQSPLQESQRQPSRVMERLSVLENNQKRMLVLLKKILAKKEKRSCEKPDCLPFKSKGELRQFTNINDEKKYDSVVAHLCWLGGINETECASKYLQVGLACNNDLLEGLSWKGADGKFSLEKSKFAKACQEAMASNNNFEEPTKAEFDFVMSKALKSLKERLRRYLQTRKGRKRPNQEDRSGNNNDDSDEERTHNPPKKQYHPQRNAQKEVNNEHKDDEETEEIDSYEDEDEKVDEENESEEEESDNGYVGKYEEEEEDLN